MKLDIKYIELGLENCETILIDIDDVEILDIGDISEHHLYRDGYKLETSKHCKYVRLLLKENRLYQPPYLKEQVYIYDRLEAYQDIVDIAYLDKDKNQSDIICVPWKDNSFGSVVNEYQTSKRKDDRSLEIIIKED